MNSQLIEFLTHPMIQSTNVLAYSSVVGLIVTALGFKTTKYVASGFAAAANRRRQRNWEMEDRKETKATLAARKAKEEQDARREVELAEKRAVEDNIMRIVAAMSNTSTRGLAQSAATTLGPGQYARFIKAGTNGAQYFDEKTKVMRLAQPGDTILIDRVSVEGNYAYKTKNGNEYYAHKDDVVAV